MRLAIATKTPGWPQGSFAASRPVAQWNAPTVKVDPVVNDDNIEGFGQLPVHVKARLSGWGEPANLSTVTNDVSKIQNAIRQSERGDNYQLFTLYRDIILGHSHIQSELAKRKMVVCGQPYSIQPYDKKKSDDAKACDIIKAMIEDCENWDRALLHLMEGTLWPVVASEKIYRPVELDSACASAGCRLSLKEIRAVPPPLMTYRLPYMAQGGFSLPNVPGMVSPQGVMVGLPGSNKPNSGPEDTIWNPDSWEPDLRFYRCYPNGSIDFSYANMYQPDPMRHVVHRANTMGDGVRDNYGAVLRSIIFYWFLSVQARDWFGRAVERFGSPFVVVYANMQQSDTVQYITQQLQMGSKLNGLAMQIGSKVEMKETSTVGMAEAYKCFIDMCNDEISKVIVGQTSSSSRKAGQGQGGETAKLHSEVRDDMAMFDRKTLNNCIRSQVFKPFLRLNGFTGNAPRLMFGGMDAGELQQKTQALGSLFGAGIRVKEESLGELGEEVGYQLEYAPIAPAKNGDNATNKTVATA